MADLKLSFKLAVDTAAASSVSGFAAKTKGEINSIAVAAQASGKQMDAAFGVLGIRSTAAIREELQRTRSAHVAIANDARSHHLYW